jgi:hypothetical protein
MDEDDAIFDLGGGNNLSSHPLYDAIVSPENQDQPLRAIIEKDSQNFLSHVQEAILKMQTEEDQRAVQLGGVADTITEISFEELIDPAENSNQVAAAALLHILKLATRNFVNIEQDREIDVYAPITIRVL